MKKHLLFVLLLVVNLSGWSQQVPGFTALYNYWAALSEDGQHVLLKCGDTWFPSNNSISNFISPPQVKVFDTKTGQLELLDSSSAPARTYNTLLTKTPISSFYHATLINQPSLQFPDTSIVLAVEERLQKEAGKKKADDLRYLGRLPEGDLLFYSWIVDKKKWDKSHFVLLQFQPVTRNIQVQLAAYPSPLLNTRRDFALSRDGKYIYHYGMIFDRKSLQVIADINAATNSLLSGSYDLYLKFSVTGDSLLYTYPYLSGNHDIYVFNWRSMKAEKKIETFIMPDSIVYRNAVEVFADLLHLAGPGVDQQRFGYVEDSYRTDRSVEDFSADGNILLYKTSTRLWLYNRKTNTVTFLYDQTLDRKDFLADIQQLNNYLSAMYRYRQKNYDEEIREYQARVAREDRAAALFMAGKKICPNCKGSGIVGVVEERQVTPDVKYIDLNGNVIRRETGLTVYKKTSQTASCPVCGGTGYVEK